MTTTHLLSVFVRNHCGNDRPDEMLSGSADIISQQNDYYYFYYYLYLTLDQSYLYQVHTPLPFTLFFFPSFFFALNRYSTFANGLHYVSVSILRRNYLKN